ncbi:MAG: alpha/beta fold hydrolase [Thermoleophilia bacterium]|nr:alpha/beta fold hydrolase [Thermoleophilia bacterium]
MTRAGVTPIWYRSSPADGPVVLLVHGLTGTGEIWAPNVPAFEEAGLRPVVVDRRGAGRSSAGSGTPADRAGDLVTVLDSLGVRRAHLVGHAAGGADVLAVAVRHPGRAGGLVLSNTQAGYADEDFRAEIARLWTPAVTGLAAEARELSADYRAREPAGTRRWLEVYAAADHSTRSAGPPPALVSRSDLAALRAPALLIAGDEDLLTPPALMRMLADSIPGARLEVIERTAHVSAWERPAAWNATVLEFLSLLPDPRAAARVP